MIAVTCKLLKASFAASWVGFRANEMCFSSLKAVACPNSEALLVTIIGSHPSRPLPAEAALAVRITCKCSTGWTSNVPKGQEVV